MRIFIPGNVPSLKNSKIATSKGVFASKTVRKYLQALGVKSYSVRKRAVENYKTRPNLFSEAVEPMLMLLNSAIPPHLIGFHFVRGTKHKFDWINAVQIMADLLVVHRVIPEDDMTVFIPYAFPNPEGDYFSYDKKKPGCILAVF